MCKPQTKTGLTGHKQFSNPAVNTGALRKTKENLRTCKEATKEKDPDIDDQQLQRGLAYPELGCVKVFVSIKSLEHHLDSRKHFYRMHVESTYNVIKRKWAYNCTSVGTAKGSTSY